MPLVVQVRLIGPIGKTTEVSAVVDEDSLFGFMPASILKELGAKATRMVRRLKPDGSRVEAPLGQIQAEVQGETGFITCVFADDYDIPRLGSHNLDTLLLQMDWDTNSLIPKQLRVVSHF
jgi:hypothetical protein